MGFVSLNLHGLSPKEAQAALDTAYDIKRLSPRDIDNMIYELLQKQGGLSCPGIDEKKKEGA